MQPTITTGLLLQATPYLEKRKILKILTAEHGLITLITDRKISPILTTPFVWAEWVYTASAHRTMPLLKDGSLLDDLHVIKKNFSTLSAAGQIANDLLRTQLPGKPASVPLALALAYLQKLSLFHHPEILVASFRLKLLSHEGVLQETDLTTLTLQTLCLSRSFQELASLSLLSTEISQVNFIFEIFIKM